MGDAKTRVNGRRPYLTGCVLPKVSYSQQSFPSSIPNPFIMPVETDIRPRKPSAGPEPLRRKRAPAPLPAASPRRRRLLNLCLGFATAVLLIDAFVGEKGLLEGVRARQSYEEAEAALRQLKIQNARLREDVRRYDTDAKAIEALAREELNYVKPGEVLFILRDVKPAGSRDAKPAGSRAVPSSVR